MYILMTYDVEAKRTHRFRKLLRRYLSHKQFSVFSGDLSKAKLFELRKQLAEITIPGDRVTEITANNRHNVKVVHLVCNESGKGEVKRIEDSEHKTDFQVL
jgi:CRISPR-associated protein Cas2